MTQERQQSGPFGRLWTLVLKNSERVVTTRYDAPWARPARAGGEAPKR